MANSLITHAVCMKNGIINFEINTKICYKDKVFILNKPFENSLGKIMFPGDPSADGANVWNCRCSMAAVVKGFKKVR